ncbi:phosphoprotein [Lepeophtheirus salmonis rhabdovirus 127]|uniref:Phosphoprotein n=1 Tax=Lepeophtheirus salmonis rhabdovirus 127 TaxID=1573761 RepID=A0A0A1E924_9RHAB|nr:phosphoprotein [Lepeophtheirus salmonis rhabdovirus 127]AIY25913.1 phosphoprotein [Lepeophtheirus salmonis rhabdovirus 127]
MSQKVSNVGAILDKGVSMVRAEGRRAVEDLGEESPDEDYQEHPKKPFSSTFGTWHQKFQEDINDWGEQREIQGLDPEPRSTYEMLRDPGEEINIYPDTDLSNMGSQGPEVCDLQDFRTVLDEISLRYNIPRLIIKRDAGRITWGEAGTGEEPKIPQDVHLVEEINVKPSIGYPKKPKASINETRERNSLEMALIEKRYHVLGIFDRTKKLSLGIPPIQGVNRLLADIWGEEKAMDDMIRELYRHHPNMRRLSRSFNFKFIQES